MAMEDLNTNNEALNNYEQNQESLADNLIQQETSENDGS
jgi:hypothetical protein